MACSVSLRPGHRLFLVQLLFQLGDLLGQPGNGLRQLLDLLLLGLEAVLLGLEHLATGAGRPSRAHAKGPGFAARARAGALARLRAAAALADVDAKAFVQAAEHFGVAHAHAEAAKAAAEAHPAGRGRPAARPTAESGALLRFMAVHGQSFRLPMLVVLVLAVGGLLRASVLVVPVLAMVSVFTAAARLAVMAPFSLVAAFAMVPMVAVFAAGLRRAAPLFIAVFAMMAVLLVMCGTGLAVMAALVVTGHCFTRSVRPMPSQRWLGGRTMEPRRGRRSACPSRKGRVRSGGQMVTELVNQAGHAGHELLGAELAVLVGVHALEKFFQIGHAQRRAPGHGRRLRAAMGLGARAPLRPEAVGTAAPFRAAMELARSAGPPAFAAGVVEVGSAGGGFRFGLGRGALGFGLGVPIVGQ